MAPKTADLFGEFDSRVGNIVNFVLDLNVFKFNIKLFTVANLLEFRYIFCIYIFLDIYRKFT